MTAAPLPRCPVCKSVALVRTSGPFVVLVCPRSGCKNDRAAIAPTLDRAAKAFGR